MVYFGFDLLEFFFYYVPMGDLYLRTFLFLFQHVKDLPQRLTLHKVENNGFEPLTPCLQSRCSSQLS